jgi:quercetin dioxygenase-like cupin family protein
MHPPSEGALRARLAQEGLLATAWGNGPHDRYGEHRHPYDKVLVAAAGSIVFHLPELKRDVLLEAGDRLDLPAGTLHGADVGHAGVTCLEAHLPAGSLDREPGYRRGWAASDPGSAGS